MIITQVDIWTVVVPVFPETVHSEEYGGYPDWAGFPSRSSGFILTKASLVLGKPDGDSQKNQFLKLLNS